MQSVIRPTAPSGALIALLCVISACAQAQPRPTVAVIRREPTRVETTAPGTVRPDTSGVRASAGALLAALGAIEMHTRRVLGISGLRPAHLTFIDARNLLRGDSQVALDQAIGRSERKITRMRSDLQSSMILRDALVERDIPMSQVIAVEATPDASRATIYYRPQE